MTSWPASRRARATILAPRSCPSRPGFADHDADPAGRACRDHGAQVIRPGDEGHAAVADQADPRGETALRTQFGPPHSRVQLPEMGGFGFPPRDPSVTVVDRCTTPDLSGASFMGNHRADRRGHSRRPSETPDAETRTVGKRKAVKPASRRSASRGPLFRGLPSAPILVGVAALAVSAGGAVTAATPGLVELRSQNLSQASALNGASDVDRVSLLEARTAAISRDSRRDALADAADDELVAAGRAAGRAAQRRARRARQGRREAGRTRSPSTSGSSRSTATT